MKFYEFIEYLQKENPGKIVMVKSGAFFNAIGRDAIVLERVLGFKRTCHSKLLCKCGMPVSYVREKKEVFEKRLKEKNISIVIFDEIKGGKYKYKEKEYDILFNLEGKSIDENRKSINCSTCPNNVYGKHTNKYEIEKERAEEIINNLKQIIERIKNKN